jgi:hypothetical protein
MKDSRAEQERLEEDARRQQNWKRWGPYLSERQWGTVREDYSADGDPWRYFPHDHARSRAYRWGEDGLLGISDRQGRLCFALGLWNERDIILKERLFGLTGPEGNHGEDVKECYFYLDSTPTHSYMRGLYKYPQSAFPYDQLREENRRRGRQDAEYELADTGVFDENRYFDVFVEYAKASPDDVLIRVRVCNRGPEAAALHVLPTLWFRNTWSWGRQGEGYWPRPSIVSEGPGLLRTSHATLDDFELAVDRDLKGGKQEVVTFLFTENETNGRRLFGSANSTPCVKDAFHEHVIHGRPDVLSAELRGTKAAAHFQRVLEAGEEWTLRLRLRAAALPSDSDSDSNSAGISNEAFGESFERIFTQRLKDADAFFEHLFPDGLEGEAARVQRQGYAGLLWSKQFYHISVRDWLEGDPTQPTPPASRRSGRNGDWGHLYNRDVISMPDKWEYPWYAAWDLAFHMIPFARLDGDFAKKQLLLFLREWYMHPNGQIPAYEFAFSDVNPPVHAWAAWRTYKLTGKRGERDREFLARVFQKLLLNFTWWVNRKDVDGNHIFAGGFLGLDNIGVFDRSRPLPTGGHLDQADGTAWMAFYCTTLLAMALELAAEDPSYEDIASKFFEHFVSIADAINTLDRTGLWDEQDGFYYDHLHVDGHSAPLRIRSMVGLIPLFTVQVLENEVIDRLPGFKKRMNWFLRNRQDLARSITWMEGESEDAGRECRRLLAIPSRERLERILGYVLDENEFLSPFGIRSLSRVHADNPYVFHLNGNDHRVEYGPGESDSGLFGGNSNWRGPIWFPLNFLLVESLERYHYFYGDSFQVQCPTGSGNWMNLRDVAREISRRLVRIFLPDAEGHRPCHSGDPRFAGDEHWKNLILFHEYFHGEHGGGLGAAHQTGWTALVLQLQSKLSG